MYNVPEIPGPVFLATFEDDVFSTGQFVKSSDPKYAGQLWEARTHEDEGGIAGDRVRLLFSPCVCQVVWTASRCAWRCVQGLIAVHPAKHYGITGVFKKPLELKDQDLVLQCVFPAAFPVFLP